MGSQVFGNLIAAFVLQNLDQRYYVAIMTGLSIIACILFFFVKPPIVQHEVLKKDVKDDKTRSIPI